MASKTSFFNPTIFRETLRRYWVLFAAYAAVLITMIPLDLLLLRKPSRAEALFYATQYPLIRAWHIGLVLSFVMGAVLVMFLFGYLYSSRQTSLFASLPVTRNSLFFTLVCAALTGLLAANVFTVAILLLAQIKLGTVSLMVLGKTLLLLILMNLVFFGFALFCGMLTGSVAIMPLVYGVLSIAAYGYTVLFSALGSRLIFGYVSGDSPLMYLSPILVLLRNGPDPYYRYMEAYGTAEIHWFYPLVYAGVGILFLGLAWLLYRRRRMESATDTVSFAVLKPLFRICMTVGFALLVSLGFDVFRGYSESISSDFLRILVLSLLGGLLGYWLAEAILQKTFRIFQRKTAGRCAILLAVLTLALFATRYDLLHIASRIPAADRIQAVHLGDYGPETPLNGSDLDSMLITDPSLIEECRSAHRSILDHREIHRQAREMESNFIYLDYILKNGRVLSREYYLDPATQEGKADSEWLGEILNAPSYLQTRKDALMALIQDPAVTGTVDYYVPDTDENNVYQLSSDQLQDLLQNCLIPDLEESSIANYFLDSETYYRNVYTWTIGLSVEQSPNNYHYAYISVPADAVRCVQWIENNLGLAPLLISDGIPEEDVG